MQTYNFSVFRTPRLGGKITEKKNVKQNIKKKRGKIKSTREHPYNVKAKASMTRSSAKEKNAIPNKGMEYNAIIFAAKYIHRCHDVEKRRERRN